MTFLQIIRNTSMSLTLAGVAIGFCLLFPGCNSKDGPKRDFVAIGTAPGGGAFFAVGTGIANVLEAHKGELNWSITAEETKGTQDNIRQLQAGEIKFAMANAAISYFAVRGEGDKWPEKQDIRAVATIAPNVGVFVTTKSTGIETMADLKGKKVVLGPSGAGFEAFLVPLLAAHGLSYDDMEVKNGNYLEAAELLGDGGADAAFMGGAIPIPAVTSLCSTQDVVFIKMSPDATNELSKYPFYSPMTVPAEKYTDLEENLATYNVGNMQLITHANVDEDIVYNFTKLLYENRAEVVKQHPAGKAINPKNVVKDTGTPFHSGAIKYYKEARIWPDNSQP